MFITGGSGGVGTFFIKLAQHYGIDNIIATAGSPASIQHLESLGLSQRQIVNYKDPNFAETALERNGGKPYDAALDFVGGAVSEVAAEVLRIGGTFADITFLGTAKTRETLFNKSASLQHIAIYSHAFTQDHRLRGLYSKRLNELSSLFERQALSPLPIQVVGGLSVETVQRAHTLLESNSVKGKLIMSM
ncbi:zinc-binding dehydrogenase [Pontibacter ummariensis]|uniref:Zinc-binding dehydrogenase n=1 Tax=Pontibacter ummariensis TaxID=1610492 RepID=A0A239LDC8_9BACT|nr:zinc-binding dehydrogenase [Pontibacter ummariensis]PRY03658.1 zinc-binding dehydrogenase [Pontibacter ummariensis]SNT28300.1 Zinc-binding dehydrogenase [Pontibacter ummariensis]